jgi:alkylhydroperoxidase family enzyme
MDPMFLPDVEQNPKKGPWREAIDLVQRSGLSEYPQIWHLFAYRPEATQHLARFTQAILRDPAPLSPGLRELIAAFTSARNDCPF